MNAWLIDFNFQGKLMILLRDGRTLIGYLRSVDQFANLVLHKAIGKVVHAFDTFVTE